MRRTSIDSNNYSNNNNYSTQESPHNSELLDDKNISNIKDYLKFQDILLNIPDDILCKILHYLDLESIKHLSNTTEKLQYSFLNKIWCMICKSHFGYVDTPLSEDFNFYGLIYRILYYNHHPNLKINHVLQDPHIIYNNFIKMLLHKCIMILNGKHVLLHKNNLNTSNDDGINNPDTNINSLSSINTISLSGHDTKSDKDNNDDDKCTNKDAIHLSNIFVSMDEQKNVLWLCELILYREIKYVLHYNFILKDDVLKDYTISILQKRYIFIHAYSQNHNLTRYFYIFDINSNYLAEGFDGIFQPHIKCKVIVCQDYENISLIQQGNTYQLHTIPYKKLTLLNYCIDQSWYFLLETDAKNILIIMNFINLTIKYIDIETNFTLLGISTNLRMYCLVNYAAKVMKIKSFASNIEITLDFDIAFYAEPIPTFFEINDMIWVVFFQKILILSKNLEILYSIAKPDWCIKWIFSSDETQDSIDIFLESRNDYLTYYKNFKKDELAQDHNNFLTKMHEIGMKIPHKSSITIVSNAENQSLIKQTECSTITMVKKIQNQIYCYSYNCHEYNTNEKQIVIDFFKIDNKEIKGLLDVMLLGDKNVFNMAYQSGKVIFRKKADRMIKQIFDLETGIQIYLGEDEY